MRVHTFVAGLLFAGAAAGLVAQGQPPAQPAPARPGLTLRSPAFTDGGEIPPRFTQSSQTPISPQLEWTNIPDGTVSFALYMHDPDVAPQQHTDDVLHWIIFNIPANARELPEAVPANAQLPDGSVQLKNQGGVVGYRGPGAPAAGPHHHYTLELFALDVKLPLGPDATRADFLKAVDGHILGKGVLVGRFHR